MQMNNKSLIEVLFEFKEVGAEVIDSNRKKLAEMASVMAEASRQASTLAKTHSQIDSALEGSTDVIVKKTKAEKEAERESKRIAQEEAKRKKEQLVIDRAAAAEQKKIDKQLLDDKRAQAAEQKKIATEAKALAKQKNDEEKAAAAEQKKRIKENNDALKAQAAQDKKNAAQARADAKTKADADKAALKAKKDIIAQQKVAEKARTADEKAAARERIAALKLQEQAAKESAAKIIAAEKEIARQKIITSQQNMAAARLADMQDRINLVNSLKAKRAKEQADKEAMLAANRAARAAERQAEQEVKAKAKIIAAQQKATAAAQKAAAASANANSKSSNGGGGGGSGGAGALADADKAIGKLNLVKAAIGGAVAASIGAIVIFTRNAADEFYKMKLAAENAGFDVTVLQEYKSVLDSVGVSTDSFAQKLRQLNEKFVEGFTEASGDGMEVIKTLNLELKEFAEASPEKKFEMIAEATKDLSKSQRLQLFDKLGLDELALVANRLDLVKKRSAELQKSGLLVTDEEAGRIKDVEIAAGQFADELKAFSTIIYSQLVPAFKDIFGDMFEGFDLSRDGANDFATALIGILKWFGKVVAGGKLMFDTIINKFKIWGAYSDQVVEGILYLYRTMKISVKGIIDTIKRINIGEAIADLSKKTFAGIIDVVFSGLDTMVSGIERLANSISGVVPDAVLKQITESRSAISQFRNNLYTYEQSEESKRNEEIIKEEKKKTDAELALEKAKWKDKQAEAKDGLTAIREEQIADQEKYIKSIDKINAVDPRANATTMGDLNRQIEERGKKSDKALIKMETDEERRTKRIEELMKQADVIKAKVDLGLIDPKTNAIYDIADAFKLYDEAIGEAAGNAKLLNKELELRIARRDDEISFFDTEYSKKADNVKKSLENLKTLDNLTGEGVFNNSTEIIAKYDELIRLAKVYKKDEADISALIKEKKDYIQQNVDAQKKYAQSIADLETQLLGEQEKNNEVRARERAKALADIEQEFKNASPEQRRKALDLTESLFNIKNAKARIGELDDEIDKLIERRASKTDVFDRTKMLELEGQINEKIKEREGLEESIGKKRDKGNDDFKLTLDQISDILDNTYTNFSTLISSAVSGVSTLKEATKTFFQDTLKYLASLFQKLLVMKAAKMIGSYFGFSDFSGQGGAGNYYHEGGTVYNGSGDGSFGAMGKMSAKEVDARLNKGEAVLTKKQQENLGNSMSGGVSGGAPIIANIHNNIDANSLATSIGGTRGFADAFKNELTRNSSTYRQILN